MWPHLKLRPSTAPEFVEFVVARTKQVPLEVEINTNGITPSSHDFMGAGELYKGVALALKTMPRWRALPLDGFPGQSDFKGGQRKEVNPR